MVDRPRIINDHAKCDAAYFDSRKFLETNPELYKKLASYLWAYHEIGQLIPQTLDNFFSGHYFPYAESYYELENSYELLLQGFYTYSLVALRSVLELGLLGIYFTVGGREHIDVRPWLTSQKRTPRRREIFDQLRILSNFKKFDKQFGLADRISNVFNTLDRFVHRRGYRYSSTGLTISNFNQFSERSLRLCCNLMFPVVTNVIIVMLLKYPIGIRGLPIYDKFGLNGPVGGFLERRQVELITSIIEPSEITLLQKLCEEDPDVQKAIEYFESLPDLTEEELKKQSEEWDRQHPKLVELINKD